MVEEDKFVSDCTGCRVMGSGIFYMSSGYMFLEALRNSARRIRAFYSVTGVALGCLGTYRLLKPTKQPSLDNFIDSNSR